MFCPHACPCCTAVCMRAISSSPGTVIDATFRPPPLLFPHPLPPLPQRKPAIQLGAEIKSLGAWPGPRPLASEVRERQPKSLPLGLYCLYRGLVIGGYGSGIKRLLPQPLRRVRHSLPHFPLPPPPPPSLRSFREEKRGAPIRMGSIMVVSLIFSSACSPLFLLVACPMSYPCACV